MFDRFEQMFIQPFVSHRPVEALDIGVLLWLSGLDKQQTDATLHRPGTELCRDVFGAVVCSDDLWLSTPLDDAIQSADSPG